MPLRVSNIRLPIEEADERLLPEAVRRAGLAQGQVRELEVVRRSLDRRRREPVFCFTVDLHLHRASDEAQVEGEDVRPVPGIEEPEVVEGDSPLPSPPVIVGAGPAGMFAALWLARQGFKPILLERGDRMNHRVRKIRDLNRDGVLDPESNYLFGEGGAGTFSDGKLTSRSKDPRARWVLEEFRRMSGVDAVTWDYRPHLGSDRVRTVVGRIRQEVLSKGGDLRFRCQALGINLENGAVKSVRTSDGEIPASVVIMAPGHSARDLYRSLFADGVPMEQKPFQLGYRVEHPQGFVDEAVWGRLKNHPSLGPADYRLAVRRQGASVFSFCMCPGGEIIPATSDLGHMNTNGMSWSGRGTGFANSGLVTTLEPQHFPSNHPLAGIELQEEFEAQAAAAVDYALAVPGQRLLDWVAQRPSSDLPDHSCRSGALPADLSKVAPPFVDQLLRDCLSGMERQMPGFLQKDALLVGPESRSSSPVRMIRDEASLEAPGASGFFPVGEGAGYAGGIVSAAVDGLRAAQAVIAKWAPSALRG